MVQLKIIISFKSNLLILLLLSLTIKYEKIGPRLTLEYKMMLTRVNCNCALEHSS